MTTAIKMRQRQDKPQNWIKTTSISYNQKSMLFDFFEKFKEKVKKASYKK